MATHATCLVLIGAQDFGTNETRSSGIGSGVHERKASAIQRANEITTVPFYQPNGSLSGFQKPEKNGDKVTRI